MIPDIENFLQATIFKMGATILHKFNIVRFQHPELIPDIYKFLPVSIFKMAARINGNVMVKFGILLTLTDLMAITIDVVFFLLK
jgi:hypothetical protein